MRPILLLLLALLAAAPAAAQVAAQPNRVVAIVNGEAITRAEVAGRARLLAFNAGVGAQAGVVDRLIPQVTRLLVEERLRIQEVQRRGVPVTDEDVANAVRDIESRNNLPPGGLAASLRRGGVEPRLLFDQVRAQIGWVRLVRGMLGPQAQPSPADIEEFIRNHNARVGEPEFLVSEIFIPLDNPGQDGDLRRFLDEVVGQLRAGVPFPIAATQFSQAQSAIEGGDLGWVRADDLDPAVSRIVAQMPAGAISNPIRVAGGYQLVTVRGRRESGRDMATLVTIRQAFLPFTTPLDPTNPTLQQRQQLERAQAVRGGCDAVEALARAGGSGRPADPGGAIRQDTINPPPLREVIAGLAPGRSSPPLITPDGILVLAVCTRESRNLAEMTAQQARGTILRERADLLARQLQRELRRRAQVEMRG
jgi:peptidyl-prolyl cis-trans isomerase SurA